MDRKISGGGQNRYHYGQRHERERAHGGGGQSPKPFSDGGSGSNYSVYWDSQATSAAIRIEGGATRGAYERAERDRINANSYSNERTSSARNEGGYRNSLAESSTWGQRGLSRGRFDSRGTGRSSSRNDDSTFGHDHSREVASEERRFTEASRRSRRSGRSSMAESTAQRQRFSKENMQFIAVFVILVLTGVLENVTYSVNGKLYMRQYRCMLNILVVLACTVFFFVIVQWQTWSQKCSERADEKSLEMGDTLESVDAADESALPSLQQGPWWRSKRRLLWFLSMAFCDCLALYMGLLSSNSVSAETRLVLQQLSIPASMAVSTDSSTGAFCGPTLRALPPSSLACCFVS